VNLEQINFFDNLIVYHQPIYMKTKLGSHDMTKELEPTNSHKKMKITEH
jgi:hypothetical protein